LLARHSQTFADMLRLPQSNNFEEYDGATLVRMPDDARQIEILLGILYRNDLICLANSLDSRRPAIVRLLFDLLDKYEVHRFRDDLVQSLEAQWPRDLQKWDKLEAGINCVLRNRRGVGNANLPEPASAIALARDFSIPSILPAAFYQLSRLSISDDEDLAGMSSCIYITSVPVKWTTKRKLLSAEDHLCQRLHGAY
ncbi:hypothetical protein BJ138DRAFT_1021138, partial [Hygrophoropsis aurantiaca]